MLRYKSLTRPNIYMVVFDFQLPEIQIVKFVYLLTKGGRGGGGSRPFAKGKHICIQGVNWLFFLFNINHNFDGQILNFG